MRTFFWILTCVISLNFYIAAFSLNTKAAWFTIVGFIVATISNHISFTQDYWFRYLNWQFTGKQTCILLYCPHCNRRIMGGYESPTYLINEEVRCDECDK